MPDEQLSLIDLDTRDARIRDASSERLSAVCLFTSAGIGELGIEGSGIEVVVANELVQSRVDLYRENFPATTILSGDVWEMREAIVEETNKILGGQRPFLVYATPPCQGMSTNGVGKLQSEVLAGRRGPEDERNRLIIPTMQIVEELQPDFLLLENVPGMARTIIRNEDEEPERILDFVHRRIGVEYVGRGEVIACDNYGIPQRRKRLITIYSRDESAKKFFTLNGGSFFTESMRRPPQTLKEAIGHLPPLQAVEGKNASPDFHPQHRVPVMKDKKRWWLDHTPEGATAFNNDCINPDCKSRETPGHREEQIDGKWVAVKDTPIYCVECSSLLPRPTVTERDGRVRALRGFHSAYRRMKWEETARTLTQNFIYEASDNKVHPSETRVLSVYEAMIIQTIADYAYQFSVQGHDIGIPRIAEVIGESVPPRLIEMLCNHFQEISEK